MSIIFCMDWQYICLQVDLEVMAMATIMGSTAGWADILTQGEKALDLIVHTF